MKLTVRIDDVTEKMDWDSFFKFKGLLEQYHIKPLLGIVPMCEDEELNIMECPFDYWEYIRNLQEEGWCMAQHGYNHVYTTKQPGIFPMNLKSEFVGLSYDEQYHKIQNGKKLLSSHGIHTSTFMAPAHSFDYLTIEALKKSGFFFLTDGYQYCPYKRQGMVYLPISLNDRRLGYYIKNCRAVTLVVHTNNMTNNSFNNYSNLFAKYAGNLSDYEEMYDEKIAAYRKYQEKRELAIRNGYAFASRIYHQISKLDKRVRENGR